MASAAAEAILRTILSFSSYLSTYETSETLKYFEGNVEETLNDKQKKSIEKLINNLALEWISQFAAKGKESAELGKALNSTHTLNTLEVFVCVSKERQTKVKQIFDDNRKLLFDYAWGFASPLEIPFDPIREKSFGDFCYFLKEDHKKDNLLKHLPVFAKKIGKDDKKLTDFIKTDNFEGFVKEVLLG